MGLSVVNGMGLNAKITVKIATKQSGMWKHDEGLNPRWESSLERGVQPVSSGSKCEQTPSIGINTYSILHGPPPGLSQMCLFAYW